MMFFGSSKKFHIILYSHIIVHSPLVHNLSTADAKWRDMIDQICLFESKKIEIGLKKQIPQTVRWKYKFSVNGFIKDRSIQKIFSLHKMFAQILRVQCGKAFMPASV